MLPQKEIQALFQLIDDPDHEVYDTVATHILGYGKEIIPSLEHLWEHTLDQQVQDRIAQLIHRVYFADLQAALRTWVAEDQPELFRGAILVAQYQYPDLNIPFLLTQFEQLRKNLWLELNNYLTPIEKVNMFNGIIYNYYKLVGNELTQQDPQHFFINKVLETKQGNTFSIGILYLALARLLDIPIFAIAIPRQFLLAYVDTVQHFYTKGNDALRRNSFFIDPLNGMIYTQNDVEFYLHKMQANPQEPQYFAPQSPLQVIALMLHELAQCYTHNGDTTKADEIKLLQAIVAPAQDQ
ncbi:MAG: transglutaminase family protein [Chitinophagaceae bacterium]|nr:transglutaminase family protein [Chitinophagaceae bacterium]